MANHTIEITSNAPEFTCEITMAEASALLPTSEYIIAILRALGGLNAVMPMVSHSITRVGETNVWNVSAVTVDGRTFTLNYILDGSVWKVAAVASEEDPPAVTSAEDAAIRAIRLAWWDILYSQSVEPAPTRLRTSILRPQ